LVQVYPLLAPSRALLVVLLARTLPLIVIASTVIIAVAVVISHVLLLACLLFVSTLCCMEQVRQYVAEIFNLCDAFCSLMTRGGPAKDPTGYSELERIEKAFQRQSTFLYVFAPPLVCHRAC